MHASIIVVIKWPERNADSSCLNHHNYFSHYCGSLADGEEEEEEEEDRRVAWLQKCTKLYCKYISCRCDIAICSTHYMAPHKKKKEEVAIWEVTRQWVSLIRQQESDDRYNS